MGLFPRKGDRYEVFTPGGGRPEEWGNKVEVAASGMVLG